MRILLVTGGGRDKRASAAEGLIRRQFPNCDVIATDLRGLVRDYWKLKKGTKNTYVIGPDGRAEFAKFWARIQVSKYDAIVSYDLALAKHLLPEDDAATMKKVDVAGGMIIDGKIPTLFIADPLMTYSRGRKAEERAASAFVASFHLKKLYNRVHGHQVHEKPVKFAIIATLKDMRAAEQLCAAAVLIAFDIETWAGNISVIGFALEVPGLDYMPVIVLPFLQNLDGKAGPYWAHDETTSDAVKCMRTILGNPVPKVAHNGTYDVTYLFKWGTPVNNYIYDTMLMMQATWPSVSRALYVGASMFVDRYRYWKADGKVVGDDGKVIWQVPTDVDATHRYWKYNGLDCANTLELCLGILRYWQGDKAKQYPAPKFSLDWVWQNYIRKFSLEFGPCLYMSQLGLHVPPNRQRALAAKYQREGTEKMAELQALVGDTQFNPKSSKQVQYLLYDVLKIPVPKRAGRTTDKRYLKPLRDLNPLIALVIDSISAAKEPLNNASKYGRLGLLKNRWLYTMKAAATSTSRLASSQHNLRYGTNMQNVPKTARAMCAADEGYVLCSADYSQSDSYFVAFESGDKHMIEVVTDDRDTHSVHVEFFFGHPYDDVVKGAANKEKWVVDPVSGVRQIIKKVSHGTAYDMGGATMLVNVGRAAAVEMVKALLQGKHSPAFVVKMGLTDQPVQKLLMACPKWPDAALEKACEFAQELYYKQYPRMRNWKTTAVTQAVADFGVIRMFGGSTTLMLCHPKENKRFVPAAYGQGGTAGNINNAMLRLYFLADSMWAAGFRMLIQIHDELVTEVPTGRLDLIDRKVAIMETPCKIHGKEFIVPVEAELSMSWAPYNTVDWKGLDNKDYTFYYEKLAEEESKVLTALTHRKEN